MYTLNRVVSEVHQNEVTDTHISRETMEIVVIQKQLCM